MAFLQAEAGRLFLRAGKVSIELPVQACLQTGDEMRTCPRLSGRAAKCVDERVSARPTRKKK